MEDGSKYGVTVAKKIVDIDAANHQKIKFLVKMSHGPLDKTIAYNELLSGFIEQHHKAQLYQPNSASGPSRKLQNINDLTSHLTIAIKDHCTMP
jgi:hypothetical protein